jgi:hypothetical protein
VAGLAFLVGAAVAACRPNAAAPPAAAPADPAASAASAVPAHAPETTSQPSPDADGAFDATSPDRYTASCARLLRELEPTFEVEAVEPLVLNLRTPSRRLQLSVQRVWRYCEGNPRDCERATREYLRVTVDYTALQFGAPALAQLRAAVREAAYVESLRQQVPDLLTEPLVADLWVVSVRDTPAVALPLSAAQLGDWQIDIAHAQGLARRNVAEALGGLDRQVRALPEQGIGYIQTGNYYVSSYLLDVASWEPVAARMRGRLVVAAPARDLILYADSASPNLDRVLGPLLENLMQRSQVPLSTTVLVWTATGWEAWDGTP